MVYTTDQQKAITLSGDSLLVSAAAGSGKTAVLTERVVSKMCAQSPVPADSFMILTFTTAAADEMRSRISKSLREKLITHSDTMLIKRQLSRLASAQISTIHSACLNIIRENFESLGIDPQFSVADEARLALMKTKTLSDFVENLYERDDDAAKTVIDRLFIGTDDRVLVCALDSGSDFLKNQPYPKMFIDSVEKIDYIGASLDILDKNLSDIAEQYRALSGRVCQKAADFLNDECEKIVLVLNAVKERDFDKAQSISQSVTFSTMLRRPKDEDEVLWSTVKETRTNLKIKFLELCEQFLYADSAQVVSDRNLELPFIKSYLTLCDELNETLLQKRRDERIVSFDDIEKYALALLIKSYDGENIVKTDLAKELSERFSEIIVDEYQDCNITQELIFYALSKDGKNIFSVGDVKQSIYRFRGAQPNLFLQKQKASVYPISDTLTAPSKIDLSQNFRSHQAILSFVNSVFEVLMTAGRGIDYADGHRLHPSSLYDGKDCGSVDISVIVAPGDEKASALTRTESEAQFVAKKIKSIIGTEKIYDVKTGIERAVEPKDIAILMRAPKTSGIIFEKALESTGISCVNNNPSEKYLDTPEVRQTLAFLQVIDNPYDDIPLITLMYSDYFGFTANELGSIRAKNRKTSFYDAVREYAKTDKKTKEFTDTISELRILSQNCSVYELTHAIYEKSGILIRLSGITDGDKKRANLMLLSDIAADYEADRYRGLFAFVNYIIKLSQNDQDIPPSRLRSSDNCVSLLSIHRSKGLEYPVVFLVNAGAVIRKPNADEVMLDSKLGAGGSICDTQNHRQFKGVAYNVIRENALCEDINEYIRLLYVALTRPKCHLFVTACINHNDAEKMILDCDRAGKTPTSLEVMDSPSFLKWMLYSCIHTDSANKLRAFVGLEQMTEKGLCQANIYEMSDAETDGFAPDSEKTVKTIDKARVIELLSRKPEGDFDVPLKLSVSEIKSMSKEGEGVSHSVAFKKPRFLQGAVSGTDRGNATHRFLQFCDFEKITDAKAFDSELSRLVQDEFILRREAELVDKQKILNFLNTEIMQTLLKSGKCHKEERFMFALPANEIIKTDSNQKIIVQGVLDCWYVVDGKAVIVDYKTDRVNSADTLIERYGVQLDMYEKALYINEGIETAKKYIYSFALEQFITV